MASTPPPIFKRTKSKPAARARQASPESVEDAKPQISEEESPVTLAAKLRNKGKRSQPKSRLSFGGHDDEEGGGEVFQVKKSNLSRKVALGKHPANMPLNLDNATLPSNHGPTYDAAYLKELKASTPSARPSVIIDVHDSNISMSLDVEELSVTTMDVVDGSEAIIPLESSIKVAKERRQRLRKTGGALEEEFVSLSVVKRADEYQGPHPESRLMREEDDLGDGEDEFADFTQAEDRIALGKKSRKVEASKRRETMKEMIEDIEDQDEESAEWEQEQLRRGGLLTSELDPRAPAKVKEVYKPAPIPLETPIPTMSAVIARLANEFNALRASHTSSIAALDSLVRERAEVDDRETEMRKMIGQVEEKRAWFDSFSEWIESVAAFLDLKYPLLEKLEEEQVSLLQERFEIVSKRRRLDDEDDLSAVFGPLPNLPTEETETDESGQVISKIPPTVLRAERREARFRRRHRRQQQSTRPDEDNGFSTDSSLASDEAVAYDYALKSVAKRTKDVLADVKAEEFLDPAKGRWGVWRESYSDSYYGAYGGLGVVSVWEFWARLEMVGWNAIEHSRSLDSFHWYQGLYAYSRTPTSDSDDHELGRDGDLVASMISKAIIPRISAVIHGGGFDPYSGRHVRRLVHLAEELEANLEGLSDAKPKLESFLQSITAVFRKAAEETETLLAKFKAIQRKVPAFDPESIPARKRFLTRRTKLVGNLFRWRKYVGDRSSLDSLVKRIVEECFLEVALSGWDVGGEELSKKMCSILPEDLVPYKLKRRFGRP